VSDVHYKIQTRPLVREGALQEEASTCQTKEYKIWSWAPKGGQTPRHTGRLTVGRKFNSNSTTFTEYAQTLKNFGGFVFVKWKNVLSHTKTGWLYLIPFMDKTALSVDHRLPLETDRLVYFFAIYIIVITSLDFARTIPLQSKIVSKEWCLLGCYAVWLL
jgi:hypothetical protein